MFFHLLQNKQTKNGRGTAIFFPILLLFILLFSGCSQSKNKSPITNKIKPEDEKVVYQYSAPWDKEMFDNFYNQHEKINISESVKGGIIPHHLLAGKYIASFFGALEKQKPSVVVLIGPNHFDRGMGKVISSALDWQTPYGILSRAEPEQKELSKLRLINYDELTLKEEHSIYGPMALIKKSLPDAKILPLILKNNVSTSTLEILAQGLQNILPTDAVIISSIDFSHYQQPAVADFHDELSREVIRSFDYSRLGELEIDSTPSLYLLLKLMEKFGTQKIVQEWQVNSAEIVGNLNIPETTSYYLPLFVSGAKSNSQNVSLLFFGDMMLDRNVKKQIDKNGADYIFTKLAGEENRFFRGMDIIHANLEGPFANFRRQTSKEIAFCFDPSLIKILKKYNFNLFTIANNHTLDMGSAGLAESKKNLSNTGIEFYGDSYTLSKNSSIIKNIGGIDVAFLGLNDTFNSLDQTKIKTEIENLKKQADFVIVNIHWGQEYQFLKSNAHQQALAHLMIDNGADAIIGHHPHVAQEMEIYKKRPIFYSLGNFVFDQYFSPETQQGLGVGLVFNKSTSSSLSLYIFPLQSELSQDHLLTGIKREMLSKQLIDSSRLSGYNFINNHLIINYE